MRVYSLLALWLAVWNCNLATADSDDSSSEDVTPHSLDGSSGWVLLGQCNENEEWEVFNKGFNPRAVSELLFEAYPYEGREEYRLQSEECTYAVKQFNMKDQITIGKCHRPSDKEDEPSETILYYPSEEQLLSTWMSTSSDLIIKSLSLSDKDDPQTDQTEQLAKEYLKDSFGADSWLAKNPYQGLMISKKRARRSDAPDRCRWDGESGTVKGMRIFAKLVRSRSFCPNPPSPLCTGKEISLTEESVTLSDRQKAKAERLAAALSQGPRAQLTLHRSDCSETEDNLAFELFGIDSAGDVISLSEFELSDGKTSFQSLNDLSMISLCSRSDEVWHGVIEYSVLSSGWNRYVEAVESIPVSTNSDTGNKCRGRPIGQGDLSGKTYDVTGQSVRDCMEFKLIQRSKELIYQETQPKEEDNKKRISDDDALGSYDRWLSSMMTVCLAALFLVFGSWHSRANDKRRKQGSRVYDATANSFSYNNNDVTVYGAV